MSGAPSFDGALRWAFALNWGRRAWAAVVTLVLATLLGPEAFGIVALANVYIAFIEMFLEQGMTNALIQRKDLRDEHLDASFWMVLAVSVALCLLSVLLSAWWAATNSAPQLEAVVIVMSLSLPIRGLTIVQQSVLQRAMDFRSLAIRANLSAIFGGVVGIAMAVQGFDVWSLVGQQLGTALSSLVLLWRLSHWRPGRRFSFTHFQDLLGFSTGAFLSRLGLFIHRWVDTLVMGIMFGPVAVGVYRLADRLMNLPLDLSTRAVQMVSLSDFSRLQDEPEALGRSVSRALWSAVSMAVPALAVLAAVSDYLLPLLGEKWQPAVEPVKLLCLVGVVNASIILTGPLLQAVGRPHAMAGLAWGWGLISTVTAWTIGLWLREAGVAQQVLGISAARGGIAVLLHFPVHITILKRISQLSWRQIFRTLLPSLTAAAAAVSIVHLLKLHTRLPMLSPAWTLVAAGAVAGVVIAASMLALDRHLRAMLVRRLARTVLR